MQPVTPIPKEKVRRLILLIAITLAVLSVVTVGPARARFQSHQQPPAEHPVHRVAQQR
ncbi:MAG TPA: hypothetical protein VN088_04050 [Nocardioides sp.]|nr:hypothetical protein [Nocardioides sp.]